MSIPNPTPVNLGTAATYGVFAATSITNTGATVVVGDLGESPGSSVTGFPPGTVTGTQNIANGPAVTALNDLLDAITDANSRTPDEVLESELSGITVTAGVYSFMSTAILSS